MFAFIKNFFVVTMTLFGCNALECVSMNNQEFKLRPEIININSNEPSFYPYSVKISKCSGSCNNIKNPYAKLCVPDVSKNMNIKVFNLISRTNETRYIKWHETCKYKCRLDASVCNNKQRWSEDKCGYQCKELIDKGICDKGCIWNPSNCKCECDKSCDVEEFFIIKTVSPEKVEKCRENIDEKELHQNKMIYNWYLNDYEKIRSSCIVYIILFVIFSISSFFYLFALVLKRKYIETAIYWMQFHLTYK